MRGLGTLLNLAAIAAGASVGGLLAVKSLLDGFAMLASASTLGWGVPPRAWACWSTRVA
jgi:uncharacterized membrane protein YqgA involved in biofilm formation